MALPVRARLLRILLAADAAVLLGLGALLMVMPANVGVAFGFRDMPLPICYLIGLWGCALVSLGVGYVYASADPLRNVIWVRVGIVRGALEAAFGLMALANHMVTLSQAAFGIVIAAAIAAGYLILWPKKEVV